MPATNAHRRNDVTIVRDWLSEASRQFSVADIPSAQLDAEIILATALNKDRTFLHAHPEQPIKSYLYKILNKNLKLRLKRIPIAYIVGTKEFYGRNFLVNKRVLIPRPESEAIIDILSKIINSNLNNKLISLVDVGTGSGCLGITSKLEFPNLDVTLIDISSSALKIAKKNAKSLCAKVNFVKNNLLKNLSASPDIIIANLPYVDKTWYLSPETKKEPSLALFAADKGLFLIKKLISQTNNLLQDGGYIILEAEPSQHESIQLFAKKYSLSQIYKIGYAIAFIKNTKTK